MKVRLSSKVLDHIVARHPEVAAYTHEIVETVQKPDLVVRGLRGELKALRFYAELHIGPKFLVVVYRELREEKGYYNRLLYLDVAGVEGEMVWRKLQ